MKYEKPKMELVQLEKQCIVITSLGQGGTAIEGEEPGDDF